MEAIVLGGQSLIEQRSIDQVHENIEGYPPLRDRCGCGIGVTGSIWIGDVLRRTDNLEHSIDSLLEFRPILAGLYWAPVVVYSEHA